MRINATVVIFQTALIATFMSNAALYAQVVAPSAVVSSSHASTESSVDQGASATPPPAVDGLLEREALTGDWAGLRTGWQDKGVVLDSSLTQFSQGVASGGIETGSEYNGPAQAGLEFDLEKLAGWQ